MTDNLGNLFTNDLTIHFSELLSASVCNSLNPFNWKRISRINNEVKRTFNTNTNFIYNVQISFFDDFSDDRTSLF